MTQVRLGDLLNGGAEGRQAQPMRHLVAQGADAVRNRAAVMGGFALAGDHQNQTLALCAGGGVDMK